MNDLLTWATKTHKKDNVLVMAEQYQAGMSLAEIGDKFGYNQNTIRNKLKDFLPSAQEIEDFKRAYTAKQIRKARIAA